MTPRAWVTDRDHQLALVMGICDGVLLALTLAAGRLLDGQHVGLRLALAVAVSALVPGPLSSSSRGMPSSCASWCARGINSTCPPGVRSRVRAWEDGPSERPSVRPPSPA